MQTPASSQPSAGAFYRAIWRWHFYAGLASLPFLAMLAITGGLYLFKNEIDHAVYRAWENVPARSTPMLPPTVLADRTAAALGGRVLLFTPAQSSTDAARLTVRVRATGESRSAFVDPYDGRLLGSTAFGGVTQTIRKVHSLEQFGFYANCLIEIVAGWTLVLMATGLYLWWPRRGRGSRRVATPASSPAAGRAFWRNLHAVTGAWSAVVITFLALTGMPWSAVWGQALQRWSTVHGLGRPQPPAQVTPEWALGKRLAPGGPAATGGATGSGARRDVGRGEPPADPVHGPAPEARTALPWSLQRAPEPASGQPAAGQPVLSLDRAVALLSQRGLAQPFSVALPGGPGSAFVGTHRTDRAEDTRVVYLDQYTGAVLGDVGFAQYGAVGRAVDWGIAVHQGLEYGNVNRVIMLAGCVAILLLCVSALAMWWRRRPAGTLGVPPQPADPWVVRGLVLVTLPFAVVFPLLGGSLVVALGLDWLATRAGARWHRRQPV